MSNKLTLYNFGTWMLNTEYPGMTIQNSDSRFNFADAEITFLFTAKSAITAKAGSILRWIEVL